MNLLKLFNPELQHVLGVVSEVLTENKKAGAGLHIASFVNDHDAQHSSSCRILFY